MWIKLFRKRKMQTIMIFFIIMLCTILLNGAVTMLLSLKRPYNKLKEECQVEDLKIYTLNMPENMRQMYQKRFEDLKEVDSVKPVNYTKISDEVYLGSSKFNGYCSLLSLTDDTKDHTHFVAGNQNAFDHLDSNQCIITAAMMNEYHLQMGDTLTIKNSEKEITYQIAAVYADPYDTSTAYSSFVYVSELPETIAHDSYYLKVYGKDGHTGAEIQNAYKEQYDGVFFAQIETVDRVISTGLISVDITAAVFIALGAIMLVVSGLIINFMVRNVMISDSKAIAVYKTIGYTTNDILKMYLTFYFVIVVTASILGVIGSKLLSNIVLSGMFQNLGEQAQTNVIISGIPCIIIETVFVLLICYLIINKTRRQKPIYALNGLQKTNSKKQKFSKNITTAFSPFGIAKRNMLRNKKGIVGILLTLVVTIFAVNFGMISIDIAYTQKDRNDYWMGVDPSQVVINTDKDNYTAVKSIVDQNSEVDHVIDVMVDKIVYLEWRDTKGNPYMESFTYDDFNQVKLPVIAGTNPQTSSEIAISSTIASECDKKVGDYIKINLDEYTSKTLLISGIFQTYYDTGFVCRLRTDAFTDQGISVPYNKCSVYLKDGVNQQQFIDDMAEQIGSLGNVIPRTEAHASIMNMITEPQKQGIPPVIGLVFLISAINIFCIVMLKNNNHLRMNGIYKCIGYTTRDLVLSNLIYVAMIALISFVIALPLSILTYADIMKMALSVFHFAQYPTNFNIGHLILVNIITFIVFIVSTLLSSISIRKIHVRDLVIE